MTCVNCGEPIRWSLDRRAWEHESPRVRYCVKNFDADNNPTTAAQPSEGDDE